ncbi:regulator of chromosome condensation 1/beta-lactamase-inhibitor protein II [Diplogelasinospora grovesii]|uniref:Regulator of chromosome condensation 1/beta-lactamase-inhibitor protein II n=1 Tax=Diplogelasinospora grovesii TaxID=303347 RepID=A0AAN6N3Y4_9PEZI|nr:regulator of chromosome condensation 1/beta-lactamase-inhibitor protein II [Diplogelasinospora grovesii]
MTTVLFALGSNGSGQLGIGHKEDVSVPKQVLLPEESASSLSDVRIAAGGNHTLLLTGAGELYWSGDASTGACGRTTPDQESAEPQFHPVDLVTLEQQQQQQQQQQPVKVGLVAATWEASVITTLDPRGKNTKVYTFGVGLKGELGLGEFIIRTSTPTLIQNFPPEGTAIVDLSACMGHTAAVLDNGEVWGWGTGRKGQLGTLNTLPTDTGVISTPHKILDASVVKVTRAVCGREFTCLFGPPETGEVVVLGSDKWGIKSNAPGRVPGYKDVGASWGSVFVLMEDGRVLSWGRNDHGQLAPSHLPKIKRIAVGSEHALALSEEEDGDSATVTAWGWGEHGNCGPMAAADDKSNRNPESNTNNAGGGHQNIIASSKYIPPGSEFAAIGAGCATSWVVIEIPS